MTVFVAQASADIEDIGASNDVQFFHRYRVQGSIIYY